MEQKKKNSKNPVKMQRDALGALDIMPKTSEVNFFQRINIGSSMVTVVYMGEVAAAHAASEAAAAGKTGEATDSYIIARPHKELDRGR